MSDTDPLENYRVMVKIAAGLAVVLTGYYIWSFFNSSRYQALCGASYWELSNKELEACKDAKTELDK